jgi:serine protease
MTLMRTLPALLALIVGVLPAFAGQTTAREMGPRQTRTAPTTEDSSQARVIVKYRNSSLLMQKLSATGAQAVLPLHATTLGQRLGYALQDGRVLGERTQALRGQGLASSDLASKLRQQADVEWAVVDERRTISNVPNDPYYGANQTSITPAVGQWYLRAPDSTVVSAINAPAAWDVTKGSASVVVAVLDTGVRTDHPDLAAKLLPGYDFVSDTTSAGDSNGRDADASDPGDYTTARECGTGTSASSSSWHGTQTAGLVGAATDNSVGMASVGRNVMVLPVRVLGKCGGTDSDIIAAMYWAAGLTSTPTVNPNPAKVISMSLGKSGSCPASYQDVFTALANAGVTVVVAAGNDAGLAVSAPGNCTGALAVAGLRHIGSKVGYSSIGPQVAIAAPAGNCVNTTGACLYPILTTINAGTTTPTTNTYSDSTNYSVGTSFSTPIVAGAVALMLSVDPTLTPAAIKAKLQATARPFPTSGSSDSAVAACKAPTATEQLECYCTTTTCGAGMLDVGAAVAAVAPVVVAPPTAAIAVSSSTPTVGDAVTLNAASSVANGGRSIAAYLWTVTAGGTSAAISGSATGSTAALTTTAAGTVTVTLTVTDSAGVTGSTTSTLTVQAAAVSTPVATTSSGGGGGGGAMSSLWLGLLGWGVLALRLSRRSAVRS